MRLRLNWRSFRRSNPMRQSRLLRLKLKKKALSHTKFDIEIEDGVYYVDAKWLEPVMALSVWMIIHLFNISSRFFVKSGIIDKLEEMGINEGDTVNILGFEFDYVR